MSTNRTAATATRTRLAAVTAVLVGLTLTLTACGGNVDAGDGSEGTNKLPDINGVWIVVSDSQSGIVGIDGDKITYIEPAGSKAACSTTKQAIADIEAKNIKSNGKRNDGEYQIVSTGTINNSHTRIVWDDGNGSDNPSHDGPKEGYLSTQEDSITIEYPFSKSTDSVDLYRQDNTLAKAAIADKCD